MTSSLPETTATNHKAFEAVNAERVVVLDFGSQYAQLIARRVREQHVYCEIVRHDITAETTHRDLTKRHHSLWWTGKYL